MSLRNAYRRANQPARMRLIPKGTIIMLEVSINSEQRLYVLSTGHGYSCFGFENAQRQANHIVREVLSAQMRGVTDHASLQLACAAHPLYVSDGELGTLEAYEKSEAAVQLWANSSLASRTYWAPGTPEAVRRVLASAWKSRINVRLVYGDPDTGCDHLQEFDTVGRIGRTGGLLKSPILVPEGECGGSIVSSDRLVRIINWDTGRELYRHPLYQVPELSLCVSDVAGYAWEALHEGTVHARFKSIGEAGAWVAFMTGIREHVIH
jgi:hypothetical protein